MTQVIGVIGGTGLTELEGLEIESRQVVETPFGVPSSEISWGILEGKKLAFLSRHGNPHRIPPHQVNYRANIWALHHVGVTEILAVNAVGGIHSEMGPAKVVIPDQVIDYTYGRKMTYFEGDIDEVTHIDFTHPYDLSLRKKLIDLSGQINVNVVPFGVYGATQGPRLETAAEIKRMERDGCDLVGMTGMPEAALAAELMVPYVCLSLVVNWAAGKTDHIITMEEIGEAIDQGMGDVRALLSAYVKSC